MTLKIYSVLFYTLEYARVSELTARVQRNEVVKRLRPLYSDGTGFKLVIIIHICNGFNVLYAPESTLNTVHSRNSLTRAQFSVQPQHFEILRFSL